MNEADKIRFLEKENARLTADNQILLKTVAQMKVTLNRLIDRYLMNKERGNIA